MQQALRQEANRMVTFTDEHDTPIIRKTHKGEELVQSEDVMPDTEIVEIPPYLGASNERSDAGSTDQDTSEPHSPTEDADDSSSPSTGASAPPSSSLRSSASDGESQASPSTTPPDSPPFRRSDDNVDTGDGSDSPDRDQLRETLQARKVESGLTEFFEQSQPPTQSAASPPPDNAPRPAEKKSGSMAGVCGKVPGRDSSLGCEGSAAVWAECGQSLRDEGSGGGGPDGDAQDVGLYRATQDVQLVQTCRLVSASRLARPRGQLQGLLSILLFDVACRRD